MQEMACFLHCTALYIEFSMLHFSQNLEVLRDFHRLQKQSNYRHSPYIRHVYRSVWPARAKPRFGATLVRSAYDYETRLLTLFLCPVKFIQESNVCSLEPNIPF